MITQTELKLQLNYDPETGIFIRVYSNSERVKNRGIPEYKTKKGYKLISVNGKYYLSHRLAWLFMNGDWPKDEIGHINKINDDNRWLNLRSCTHQQNIRNRGTPKNNTSGFKGVSWHVRVKKWTAQIWCDGKNKSLGYFDNPELAHAAYCKAADKYHGEFANYGQ